MNHPTPLIALVVLAGLAVGGCTSTTPGAAGGTTRSAQVTSSASAADPLARVDPCSLLGPVVISQNQLQPNKSGIGPGDRYCRWDTGSAVNGVGYNIAVNIYDQAGLDQLSTAGFIVTNYPVGHHPGRMSKDTAGGGCSVSIGITNTSRVDVVGIDYGGQQDRACAVATTVAPSVEKMLPSGNG